MDAAAFGLLGTAIGALASFGGIFISNQYSLKKEREATEEQRREEGSFTTGLPDVSGPGNGRFAV